MASVLRVRGVDVEILTSGAALRTERLEVVEGVPVHRVPAGGGSRPYWDRLRKVLGAIAERRREFDVVLFHGPNHDLVYAGCLAGCLLGWKVLFKMTLLGSDDLATIRGRGRFGRVRLGSLRFASGLIGMTRIMTRGFEDTRWISNRMLIAPQGVDTDRFSPPDATQKISLRKQLDIPESAKVALFCGALVRRKGVDLLVEAWRHVAAQVKGGMLLLVGPDHRHGLGEPEHRLFSEGIERRVKQLGIDGTVRFLGYQSNVEKYYGAADLFVFPSRSEGWGSVVTEALASGLPCVLSGLEGISDEHIEDGKEGFIVRTEAPEAYSARMVELLEDESAMRRMGKKARTRAVNLFDHERVADQYAEFLHRTCGREFAGAVSPGYFIRDPG